MPVGYSSAMDALILFLLLLAAAFFLLATFNATVRFNLIAAGLFCWVLTVFIPALDKAL